MTICQLKQNTGFAEQVGLDGIAGVANGEVDDDLNIMRNTISGAVWPGRFFSSSGEPTERREMALPSSPFFIPIEILLNGFFPTVGLRPHKHFGQVPMHPGPCSFLNTVDLLLLGCVHKYSPKQHGDVRYKKITDLHSKHLSQNQPPVLL